MMKTGFYAFALSALLAAGAAQATPVGCPGNSCDAPGHNDDIVSVPEPGTLAMLATGLSALGFAGWRRRKSNSNKDSQQ
jgi:hypothetical protein